MRTRPRTLVLFSMFWICGTSSKPGSVSCPKKIRKWIATEVDGVVGKHVEFFWVELSQNGESGLVSDIARFMIEKLEKLQINLWGPRSKFAYANGRSVSEDASCVRTHTRESGGYDLKHRSVDKVLKAAKAQPRKSVAPTFPCVRLSHKGYVLIAPEAVPIAGSARHKSGSEWGVELRSHSHSHRRRDDCVTTHRALKRLR